jgi:hypothetical protein
MLDRGAQSTSACIAAPEDAHCRRTAAFERKQPLTVGPRKNRGGFRNRSPMTRTRLTERSRPAAFQGSVPIGTPTICGRSRTRPLRKSCAPANSRCASEADRSASGGAQHGLGAHRVRGRCRRRRRIPAGVAGCRACRYGWVQPWLMRGRGRRFPEEAALWDTLYSLGMAACPVAPPAYQACCFP